VTVFWLVNLVLAFVLVKFIIYPGIGLLFGTDFPIVAVVSGSMEHDIRDFATWWQYHRQWYEDRGFTAEQFAEFPFYRGFNKGDIMVLVGVSGSKVRLGNVLVYESRGMAPHPIIHRVVAIRQDDDGNYYFTTKGDNNAQQDSVEVNEFMIKNTGKAVLRLPYLGWVKIAFVNVFGDII